MRLLSEPGMREELVLADGVNEFKVVWVMVFTCFGVLERSIKAECEHDRLQSRPCLRPGGMLGIALCH